MTHIIANKQWILGLLSILLLASIIIGAFIQGNRIEPTPEDTSVDATPTVEPVIATPEPPEHQDEFSWIMDQVAVQQDIDEMLLAELDSGAYTQDSPLVILDPYGISPLTALVLFTTSEPSKIAILVPGKDSHTVVRFTFDDYRTEHILPVYGLYPSTVNKVSIRVRSDSGTVTENIIPIETQPLPGAFDEINTVVHLPQPNKVQPGFTFAYSANKLGGKVAFDVNGDYRWYLQGPFINVLNYDINGHMLLPVVSTFAGDVFFVETNPLGKIYRVLYAPYGCHHDVEQYQSNSVLITGSSGETVEDIIYEINLDTGEITHVLDLKNVLQRTRIAPLMRYTKNLSMDWAHINAIVKQGDDIIISARNQSAVVKLSWPDAEIAWIASRPEGYLPTFDAYVLNPTGENFEYFHGQHAPQILPDYDNNPDTLDVLLFDNRWRLHENEGVPAYSRMVHYRIDEQNRTIEQIREYGKDQGEALHSNIVSDADLLPNGNWLGTFMHEVYLEDKESGKSEDYSSVIYLEIDENNQPVWMVMQAANAIQYTLSEYRSERMDIYNDTANDLGIGEQAKNLIPAATVDIYTQSPGQTP